MYLYIYIYIIARSARAGIRPAQENTQFWLDVAGSQMGPKPKAAFKHDGSRPIKRSASGMRNVESSPTGVSAWRLPLATQASHRTT